MPYKYIGQVEVNSRWLDIIKSDDKEYVFHCLEYKAYKDKSKRVVQIVIYVS